MNVIVVIMLIIAVVAVAIVIIIVVVVIAAVVVAVVVVNIVCRVDVIPIDGANTIGTILSSKYPSVLLLFCPLLIRPFNDPRCLHCTVLPHGSALPKRSVQLAPPSPLFLLRFAALPPDSTP